MAKRGRKPIDIDVEQLEALCRMKPTLADCAAFFKCHPDTIVKFIKENFNMTFSEFRHQNMVHTRFNLVRKAINKATNGDNVMLIFCLKNLCGWKDKPEEDKIIVNNFANMTNEEIDKRIEQLSKKTLKVC